MNATSMNTAGRILRLPEVRQRVGLATSSIYAGVRAKSFPAPVRISVRAVGWREADIAEWLASRQLVGAAK